MASVLALVRRPEWEREEMAFLGTTFGFRRADRYLTAAHCVAVIPARDLLIVDLGEPMETVSVEDVTLHPEADIALLCTQLEEQPRHEFLYDTHNQIMPAAAD